MLSSYIFIALIVLLFVLYIIIRREKSAIFCLGVAWFLLDITARIFSVITFSNINTLIEAGYYFSCTVVITVMRLFEVVLLLAITFNYFKFRKRKLVEISVK